MAKEELLQCLANSMEYSEGFKDGKQAVYQILTDVIDRHRFANAKTIHEQFYNAALDSVRNVLNVVAK